MKFRVREAFLAVRNEPSQSFSFATLRPGEIINTDGIPNKSGLDIEHEGKTFAAFMRDIEDRCERVWLGWVGLIALKIKCPVAAPELRTFIGNTIQGISV